MWKGMIVAARRLVRGFEQYVWSFYSAILNWCTQWLTSLGHNAIDFHQCIVGSKGKEEELGCIREERYANQSQTRRVGYRMALFNAVWSTNTRDDLSRGIDEQIKKVSCTVDNAVDKYGAVADLIKD